MSQQFDNRCTMIITKWSSRSSTHVDPWWSTRVTLRPPKARHFVVRRMVAASCTGNTNTGSETVPMLGLLRSAWLGHVRSLGVISGRTGTRQRQSLQPRRPTSTPTRHSKKTSLPAARVSSRVSSLVLPARSTYRSLYWLIRPIKTWLTSQSSPTTRAKFHRNRSRATFKS